MQITPITIEFSKVKGYRASYNHKGIQIVEFAPTRIEAIKVVLKQVSWCNECMSYQCNQK